MADVFVYTDGGARGNPGPAAIGVYIENGSGQPLFLSGKKIGETTNNIAEYTAILEAYNWLIVNKNLLDADAKIHFYMDSLLAYSHISRLYKIKNEPTTKQLLEISAPWSPYRTYACCVLWNVLE